MKSALREGHSSGSCLTVCQPISEYLDLNIYRVVFSETIDYFSAPSLDKRHFNVRV